MSRLTQLRDAAVILGCFVLLAMAYAVISDSAALTAAVDHIGTPIVVVLLLIGAYAIGKRVRKQGP